MCTNHPAAFFVSCAAVAEDAESSFCCPPGTRATDVKQTHPKARLHSLELCDDVFREGTTSSLFALLYLLFFPCEDDASELPFFPFEDDASEVAFFPFGGDLSPFFPFEDWSFVPFEGDLPALPCLPFGGDLSGDFDSPAFGVPGWFSSVFLTTSSLSALRRASSAATAAASLCSALSLNLSFSTCADIKTSLGLTELRFRWWKGLNWINLDDNWFVPSSSRLRCLLASSNTAWLD